MGMGLMKCGLALVVLVAGCAGDDDSGGGGGGGGDGAGTVSGTINGATIAVESAISANVDRTLGSSVLHYGVVIIGDTPGLCEIAASETGPADGAFLGLAATVLGTNGAGNYVGELPTPGTYTINGQSGNVAFGKLNLGASGCDVPGTDVQSGTVTFTTAANGVYAGSFDVVFETGDHVTGTFDPSACTALTQFQLNCTP